MSTFALDINNLDFSGPYTDKLLLSKTWGGGGKKCVKLIFRQPKDLLNVKRCSPGGHKAGGCTEVREACHG